jgi:hypothetical protein
MSSATHYCLTNLNFQLDRFVEFAEDGTAEPSCRVFVYPLVEQGDEQQAAACSIGAELPNSANSTRMLASIARFLFAYPEFPTF